MVENEYNFFLKCLLEFISKPVTSRFYAFLFFFSTLSAHSLIEYLRSQPKVSVAAAETAERRHEVEHCPLAGDRTAREEGGQRQ